MKERIKALRKHLGFTQQKLADRLGLKRQTIAAYEIGNIEPSESTLLLICKEFNINEEWLRNGIEPMCKEKDGAFSELLSDLEDSDDEFIKNIITVYMGLDKDSKDALKKIAIGMQEKYKRQD